MDQFQAGILAYYQLQLLPYTARLTYYTTKGTTILGHPTNSELPPAARAPPSLISGISPHQMFPFPYWPTAAQTSSLFTLFFVLIPHAQPCLPCCWQSLTFSYLLFLLVLSSFVQTSACKVPHPSNGTKNLTIGCAIVLFFLFFFPPSFSSSPT